MSIDRRSCERVEKKVIFKIASAGFKEYFTVNISLGGLLMISDRYHDFNKTFSLEFELFNGLQLFCQARVAWVYPNIKDACPCRIGLEFLDLSHVEQELLEKFIDYLKKAPPEEELSISLLAG